MTKVEMSMKKIKNIKTAGKDEATGELMRNWVWKLYNTMLESGVLLEDGRTVIVQLYKV